MVEKVIQSHSLHIHRQHHISLQQSLCEYLSVDEKLGSVPVLSCKYWIHYYSSIKDMFHGSTVSNLGLYHILQMDEVYVLIGIILLVTCFTKCNNSLYIDLISKSSQKFPTVMIL